MGRDFILCKNVCFRPAARKGTYFHFSSINCEAAVFIWRQLQLQEREASRRGLYISQEKCGIDSTLGNASKKYAARYYQPKIGHGAVGTFFARIGPIETPRYWWCGAREQTVIQLYTECRRRRKERRTLIRELGKQSISWQTRPEKRGLASLLANERAFGPLLTFLRSTEIGSRAGSAQRELEWGRRNDEEGENLLSD